MAELEAQVSRTRKLAEREVVSRMELETQEAQLAAAQASVGQAVAGIEQTRAAVGLRRSTLDKTVLRSPIAGRVGRRQAEMGMLVNPGTVLFVVGDLERVIVDVPLTEKALARVQTGPAGQHPRARRWARRVIEATLSRVSPFLAPGSFSTTGEIDVDNRAGRLLPGMFVTVDIATGQSDQATLVPVSAVWEDARTGLLGVYVSRDRPSRAPTRPAGDGAARGAAAPGGDPGRGRAGRRLSTGVQPGDWVVTLGQHLLAARRRAPRPACGRSPGTRCWRCSRGSTRICWPRSWRSSSGWPAPSGRCPRPPTR